MGKQGRFHIVVQKIKKPNVTHFNWELNEKEDRALWRQESILWGKKSIECKDLDVETHLAVAHRTERRWGDWSGSSKGRVKRDDVVTSRAKWGIRLVQLGSAVSHWSLLFGVCLFVFTSLLFILNHLQIQRRYKSIQRMAIYLPPKFPYKLTLQPSKLRN